MFSRAVRRASAASIGVGAKVNRRSLLHTVPALPHDFSNGVPNLMSPAGFALAWTEYMSFTLDKLNALIAGTEYEDKSIKSIALMTAREPSKAPIFNYASMAHNTHFYFRHLHPTGTPIPPALKRDLEACFSSIETLRREFVLTASAMFGPGFLWLVKAGPGDYRVLPTYLAGSPYPGAHWRAQSVDMNSLGADGSAPQSTLRAQVGRKGDLPPGGIEVTPLLCLNTWEHAWLMDWGVGRGGTGGKTAFAEAWWGCLDWEGVAADAGLERGGFL